MDHVQKESLVVFPPHLCLHLGTVANRKVKAEMQAALAMLQYRETDTVINVKKNNQPPLHQNRRRRMTCRLQTVEESVL